LAPPVDAANLRRIPGTRHTYRNGALRRHRVRGRAAPGVPFLDLRLYQAAVEKALLTSAQAPPAAPQRRVNLLHDGLELLSQRVERVESVQGGLGARPVWILRDLHGVEHQLELFGREVHRPENDLLRRLARPVDRLLDHAVGVRYDLGPRRAKELFRADQRNALEVRHSF